MKVSPVSSQNQPYDVVVATCWLKLRTGARKGADANTVTQALDLATSRKPSRKFGWSYPLNSSISSKITRCRPPASGSYSLRLAYERSAGQHKTVTYQITRQKPPALLWRFPRPIPVQNAQLHLVYRAPGSFVCHCQVPASPPTRVPGPSSQPP